MALTDKARIHPSDPGHPEICTIFSYHKAFSEEDLIKTTKYECKNGKIGCVQCKNNLFMRIKALIESMNEKREYYKKHVPEIWDILLSGTRKAKTVAEATLREVRSHMKLDYLDYFE